MPPAWLEHLTPAERAELKAMRSRTAELEAQARRREGGVVDAQVLRSETVDLAGELALAERELKAANEEVRMANAELRAANAALEALR